MGERYVRALFNAGFIHNLSDIYKLSYEHIRSLPSFKEKSTENLMAAIEKSRSVSFKDFITSLGIRHVGEEVAGILANHFGSLESFANADYESILALHGIGEEIADSVQSFLNTPEDSAEMARLAQALRITYPTPKDPRDLLLKDIRFVITGTMKNHGRDELKKILQDHGAKVLSQVSSSVNYLIAGENAGSKFKAAEDLGIPIISETEVMTMIEKKK